MALLIVEDELRVRAFLARGLSEEGYAVRACATGVEASDVLDRDSFELVILDWMLPRLSGLQLLEQLRRRGDTTPVLMLTAKDTVKDRVAALNAGADDFLCKPFSFEELVARVRAILRRTASQGRAVLSCADLSLDPFSRRVTRAEQVVRLTAREFALLQFLLEHQGEVISRARITQGVWEHDFETFSNVVDVTVRHVRAKVDDPFPKKLIHTVRGVGYVLKP